jgi:uncharacterized protein YkwD
MAIRVGAVLVCLALVAPIGAASGAAPGAQTDASVAGVGASGGAAAFGAYAQRMSVLIDGYRRAHQLPPLPLDGTLVSLAAEHSAAMAKAGRMDHDDFPSRTRRSGLALCIENVGWNYPTPDAQFDAWRASPGHDRNLLDRRVERVGVAAAAGYVTLIACGK